MAYAFGAFLTFELLKHHFSSVKRIIISSHNVSNDTLEKLNELRKNIPIEINDKLINKLCDKENVYVVGEFIPYDSSLSKNDEHVVILNLDDEGEIGTIIRTSVAFNFLDIAFIGKNINLFSSKLIRATMGAIFLANIQYFDTFEEYKNKYNNKNICFDANKKSNLPISVEVAISLYKKSINN